MAYLDRLREVPGVTNDTTALRMHCLLPAKRHQQVPHEPEKQVRGQLRQQKQCLPNALRQVLVDTFLRFGMSAYMLQDLAAGDKPFVTTDYMLPTPEWAVYGADEAGFDPQEIRFKKVRNHPQKQSVSVPQ